MGGQAGDLPGGLRWLSGCWKEPWAWNQEPGVQILDLLLFGTQHVSQASSPSLCNTTPGLSQRARGDASRNFDSE